MTKLRANLLRRRRVGKYELGGVNGENGQVPKPTVNDRKEGAVAERAQGRENGGGWRHGRGHGGL